MILEDDIYGDLQGRHGVRLASLDDGRRVIYVGGFSKTLAANLRVGFVAAHPALARELRDIKALTGLSSTELCERVVARIIVETKLRTHARAACARASTNAARAPPKRSRAWARRSRDRPWAACTCGRISAATPTSSPPPAAAKASCCAPGSLFSPTQLPSTWMRVAAATCLNETAMKFLARAMQR